MRPRIEIAVVLAACACACGARTGPLCPTCDESTTTNDGSIPGEDASLDASVDAIGDASLDTRSIDAAGDVVGDGVVLDAAPPPDVIPFDTAPPPPGCPTVLPKDGSPCDSAMECDYESCDPTAPDRATCSGGAWSVRAVACSSVCPLSVPPNGSPCTVPARVACTWSLHCPFDSIGFCDGGRWALKLGGCSSDECPPSEPTGGSSCPSTPAGTGFTCTYPDACGHYDVLSCADETWSVDDVQPCSAPAPCPSTPPTPGAKCTGRLRCGYANACGTIDAYECGGDWIEFPGACATPGCPSTPSDLDPCSIEGTTCRYPSGDGCELDCTCTSGKFECVQPPCAGS